MLYVYRYLNSRKKQKINFPKMSHYDDNKFLCVDQKYTSSLQWSNFLSFFIIKSLFYYIIIIAITLLPVKVRSKVLKVVISNHENWLRCRSIRKLFL